MNEKMKKDVQRHAENLNIQIENIFRNYVLWDLMSMKQYQEYHQKAPEFWVMNFRNLQNELLLNLHEIFNEDKKNLNVYMFIKNIVNKQKVLELEKIICEHCFTKRKIKNWRNKLIAHKDKKLIDQEVESLENDFNIPKQHIKDFLIEDLLEINKIVCEEFNVQNNLKNISDIYNRIQLDFHVVLGFDSKK